MIRRYGNKAGMTQIFTDEGLCIPVSVIAVQKGNVVTQVSILTPHVISQHEHGHVGDVVRFIGATRRRWRASHERRLAPETREDARESGRFFRIVQSFQPSAHPIRSSRFAASLGTRGDSNVSRIFHRGGWKKRGVTSVPPFRLPPWGRIGAASIRRIGTPETAPSRRTA